MQRAEQEGRQKSCKIVAEKIGKQKKARRAVKSGGDSTTCLEVSRLKRYGFNLIASRIPTYRFCHLKAYPKRDYCHGEYELLLTGTHSTSMPGMNEIWNLNGTDFMIFFFFLLLAQLRLDIVGIYSSHLVAARTMGVVCNSLESGRQR